MSLSQNFLKFVRGWMCKAEAIKLNDANVSAYFDKFYTLYVVYNRLYAEVTFERWRLDPPHKLPKQFPDAQAAKEFVADFLNGPTLRKNLEEDQQSKRAVSAMEDILAGGRFSVLLRGPRADKQPKEDEGLLERFRSPDRDIQARAILQFVYAIRCNTLHGSKEFDHVQIQVLEPCIIVLSHLNRLLFERLRGEPLTYSTEI